MLRDLGLATPEQIKKMEEESDRRFSAIIGGKSSVGCISSIICANCKHIISDSICLCSGCFTCPNCQHENGWRPKPGEVSESPNFIYTGGVEEWPTLVGRLSQPITTELEALQQLEKFTPLTELGKKRLKELLDKSPNLS